MGTQASGPRVLRPPPRPPNLSSSKEKRGAITSFIGGRDSPIAALPFNQLSHTDLVDFMPKKKLPIIGRDYWRMGFIGEIQYADTHFNVIRAALMRRSRIEARKRAVHLRKLNGFLIMNLPLEIIFSIFEYLHPIDIYHLSLSSPIFQSLLNDQPTFLKNLYQSHGVPLWPLDIPYERWSDLLFGDAICDRCQKYIALPDFVHRQRICSNCFQTGFSYTYPSGMIVPKGYRQYGWILTYPTSPALCTIGVQDNLLALRVNREFEQMKSTGKSQEEIDGYVKEKTRCAEGVMLHAYDCQLWVYDLFRELNDDMKNTREVAVERLKQRLLRQGCRQSDFTKWNEELVNRWRNGDQLDHKRKSWTATLDILRSMAIQRRDQRFLYERLILIQKRSQIIALAYTQYINQPKPNPPSTPSTSTALSFSTSEPSPPSSSPSKPSQTPPPSPQPQPSNPRPPTSYPGITTFLNSKPCQEMINAPPPKKLQPKPRRNRTPPLAVAGPTATEYLAGPTEMEYLAGPTKTEYYLAWIRGLFDDDNNTDGPGNWAKGRKEDFERCVANAISSPKANSGLEVGEQQQQQQTGDGLNDDRLVPGRVGLVISTFTCSMCRDSANRSSSGLALGGRPSRIRSGGGGGGVVGGSVGVGGRGRGRGGEHDQHYRVDTQSSLSRVRSVHVNSEGVDTLGSTSRTAAVLFGWEEVKEHLVCFEQSVSGKVSSESKVTVKDGTRRGFGVGTGSGERERERGKEAGRRTTNANGVEGIMFNRRASDLLLILLGKLGLDPERTRASDLDELGKGFLCYQPVSVGSTSMRKARDGKADTRVFGWRDFVVHVLRYGQRNQFPIGWSVDRLLVKVVSTDSRVSGA